jgi:hypothetical protein
LAGYVRPEQLVEQGAKLGPAAAQDLETALEGNPEDLAARAKLLGYYYYQWMKPGEAAAKAARRRHILWLIEHHPEAPLAGLSEATLDQGGNALADEEGYAEARKLWLARLNSGSGPPAALGNLAKFFQMTDKELAEKALLAAHAAQPQNTEWDWRLGYLYAMGILGVDALGLNGQPTSVDLVARAGPFAERSRQALRDTSSGTMLSVAASYLWRYGTMLSTSDQAKAEVVDDAIQLIQHAKKAEPANPGWTQFLAQLEAYKRVLSPNPAK